MQSLRCCCGIVEVLIHESFVMANADNPINASPE